MINAIITEEVVDKKSLINLHKYNNLIPKLLARACDVTMEIDDVTTPNTTIVMATPRVDVSAFRDTKITTHLTPSVVSLSDDQVSKHRRQYCSDGKGCDTFCFTNVK